MQELATILADIVAGKEPQSFQKKVQDLCGKFPLPS